MGKTNVIDALLLSAYHQSTFIFRVFDICLDIVCLGVRPKRVKVTTAK